jgi:glycosyltransferase involved in cell wall biosynthesis
MHGSRFGLDANKRVPEIHAPAPTPTLICFAHLRWNFVFQRPQHLLSRAARDYRVIFIEEPIYTDDRSPGLDLRDTTGGVTVAVPVLPNGLTQAAAEAAQRVQIDGLVAEHATHPLVFWYYTPMALGFTAHHRPDTCIYDCMDELSAFRFAPPDLIERERQLFARADLVFTGGLSLYEAKRTRHPEVHTFPSSIDAPHFAKARSSSAAEPVDQAGIAHPRLGYFGVIDERLDLELLAAMADLRPGWQFVMIGPVVKIAESDLPRRPNIHWLGGKSYDELPAYLAGWDVGLMPFALNESTRYISPTKTPEFLAAGVPVVSTAVADVVRTYGGAGLVEIASDAASAVASAELLMGRPKAAWLDQVDAALAGTSWDRTWAGMNRLIRGKLETATPVGSRISERRKAVAHV